MRCFIPSSEWNASHLVANDDEAVVFVKEIARLPPSRRVPVYSHWGVAGGNFAARAGKADVVRVLLARGATVEAKEHWRGQTALMWAASEGHTAVVKQLLAKGAGRSVSDKVELLFGETDFNNPFVGVEQMMPLKYPWTSLRRTTVPGPPTNEMAPFSWNVLLTNCHGQR